MDDNTLEINLPIGEDGGKIKVSNDLWGIIEKYRGNVLTIRSDEMDIHIVIHEKENAIKNNEEL